MTATLKITVAKCIFWLDRPYGNHKISQNFNTVCCWGTNCFVKKPNGGSGESVYTYPIIIFFVLFWYAEYNPRIL